MLIRRFLVAVVVLSLFAAGAVDACEQCIPKGSRDPDGGGPYNSAICWTISSGGWSSCVGGDTKCSGDDLENSCPVGGGPGCITFNDGRTLCPENPEPVVSEPLDRCRATDVAGRCVARPTH